MVVVITETDRTVISYTVDTLDFSISCNRLQPIEKASVSPTLWP